MKLNIWLIFSAESGIETTKPLLRQLEMMQETSAKRSKAWEKQESILVEKLGKKTYSQYLYDLF